MSRPCAHDLPGRDTSANCPYPPPPVGNTIAGRYEVLGPLGSGILGYVVRGRDVTSGEERAIKLFNPQDVSESARTT